MLNGKAKAPSTQVVPPKSSDLASHQAVLDAVFAEEKEDKKKKSGFGFWR